MVLIKTQQKAPSATKNAGCWLPRRERSKTMGALKRAFGSVLFNVPHTDRPFDLLSPESFKANTSLPKRLAVASTRGPDMAIIILPQNFSSLFATLLRTMSLSCRVPPLQCGSSTIPPFLPPGCLLMFTKQVLALAPSVRCSQHQPRPLPLLLESQSLLSPASENAQLRSHTPYYQSSAFRGLIILISCLEL